LSGSTVLGNDPVELIMEYFENVGGAVAELAWESASVASNVIPQSAFCAADPNTAIPPFVSMVAPLNNATASFGTPVTLTANVTQESAPVDSVTFYNGTTPLATVTQTGSGTYTRTTWIPPAVGIYNINAVVNYNGTNTLNSVAVNKLTVTPVPKSSVHIDSIVDNGDGTITIKYSGGAGLSFTLLKSTVVPTPTGNRDSVWTVVGSDATGSPGSFANVPKAGAGNTVFFTIRSN
jgi:hypothetical protein